MDNNQLIPIASTAKKRSPLIPDVPTIGESGLKMRMGAWVGLFGPKGMPPELVQKLHAAAIAALALPESKDRFAKLGGDVMPLSPAEFKKMVSDEIAENKELLASLSAEKK
jgi:tripartite-type tricarboxylate transporter receptor subunit TctC